MQGLNRKKLVVIKLIVIILSISITIFLLDNLLPTTKWETTYYKKTNDSVMFSVPGTGGGTDSCAAKDIQTLPPNGDIVIEKTAILGICRAKLPFWQINTNKFVENAIHSNYGGIYSNLEDLRKEFPGFTPAVRLCGKVYWFLPTSYYLYSVELPDGLVVLNSDGAHQQQRCAPPPSEYHKVIAPLSWQNRVKMMKAKGEDIEIIKSKYMTPEKTPAEFWAAFTKELQNPKLNFDIFVKNVARGFVVEKQYNLNGIDRVVKKGLNPNYSIDSDKKTYNASLKFKLSETIIFNKQFCLPSNWGTKLFKNTKYENSELKIEFSSDRDNADCIKYMSFYEVLHY